MQFASWAGGKQKIPSKFATYVHGKEAAKEIDGKPQQPSDERKTRLGVMLNELLGELFASICRFSGPAGLFSYSLGFLSFPELHVPGKVFPKHQDPQTAIIAKGWPIRIERKPGSRLTAEELFRGHRNAVEPTIRNWIKDIEGDRFVLEAISETEAQSLRQDHLKRLKKGTSRRQSHSKSRNAQRKKNGRAQTVQKTRARDQHIDNNLSSDDHQHVEQDNGDTDHVAYVANLRKMAERRRQKQRHSKKSSRSQPRMHHTKEKRSRCEPDSDDSLDLGSHHRQKRARVSDFEDE